MTQATKKLIKPSKGGWLTASLLLALTLFSQASAAPVSYVYDNLNRLTEANYNNGQQVVTYTYDAAGNMLSKMISEGLPPNLSISTPPDGTYINSANVTIYGAATDAGSGDSGITSVTVDAVATIGGTVTGGGTANWNLGVVLISGANNLSVVATDGSPANNQVSLALSLVYIPFNNDSDGDGLDDTYETAIGTNPNNPDSDGDGITDDMEIGYDGESSYFDPSTDTDPSNGDTDGDGLNDSIDPNPLVVDIADGDLAPLGAPDGNLNAADLLIMQRIILGTIVPGPVELLHGDLYSDGVVDMSDLILQQRLIFQ